MYGLLLENLSEYIKKIYGEDRWEEIRRQANVEQPSFSVHQVYCETLIPRLAKTSQDVRVVFLSSGARNGDRRVGGNKPVRGYNDNNAVGTRGEGTLDFVTLRRTAAVPQT